MKVKLSDSSNTVLSIFSINQTFTSDTKNGNISITIKYPDQNFEYYKDLFSSDNVVKTLTVYNSREENIATFNGESLEQVSLNIQNDESYITILINC